MNLNDFKIGDIKIDLSSMMKPADRITKVRIRKFAVHAYYGRKMAKDEAIIRRHNDEWYAQCNESRYPLSERSFDCTGFASVYVQDKKTGRYIRVIRSAHSRAFDSKGSTQFKEEQHVYGRIVKRDNVDEFDVLVNSIDNPTEQLANSAMREMISVRDRVKLTDRYEWNTVY
jgi:hypothetical protein